MTLQESNLSVWNMIGVSPAHKHSEWEGQGITDSLWRSIFCTAPYILSDSFIASFFLPDHSLYIVLN